MENTVVPAFGPCSEQSARDRLLHEFAPVHTVERPVRHLLFPLVNSSLRFDSPWVLCRKSLLTRISPGHELMASWQVFPILSRIA